MPALRYPRSMKALPEPLPGRFLLLVAPHAAGEGMLELAAHLVPRGPLRVMDCGNRFNVYILARKLYRLQRGDPRQLLARVYVSRAFTCYQVTALLEQTAVSAQPTLLVDLLDTFYDQSVPLGERRRLLDICLAHLQRLSQQAAVVASLRPPRPPQTDPSGLLDAVCAAADLVWYPEIPAEPVQLQLL
jgi:hypothetical protein